MNAKQEQQQQQDQQPIDAQVSQLDQLYLAILIQAVKADRLTPVQQAVDPLRGRLWLMTTGTTVPVGMLSYQFAIDNVTFDLVTRDERKMNRVVKYAEGIDGFVEELVRFLSANRLGYTSEADFNKQYAEYVALARRAKGPVLSRDEFRSVQKNAVKQLTTKS